jgi:drug/metabolite transporter (DMT)-like permease
MANEAAPLTAGRRAHLAGRLAGLTAGRQAHLAGLIAGLITVVLWGSAFVGIRAAGETLEPGPLALGRLLVSSAILGAVAIVRRHPLPCRRDLLPIAVYGVLWLGIYSVALNAAERHVDAGTAAMIINAGPLLIAVGAGIFLREGFPRGLLGGCLVAFGGCGLIAFAAIGSGYRSGLGIVLCVVAAFAYATAVIVQKPLLRRVPPFQVAWLGCAAATIVCLPFGPALVTEGAHAGPSAIGWTLYLGAVPTAAGFATWALALRSGTAGRTGSLAFLIPVVAVVLSWLILGEAPPWLALAGGALCLVGVYLARRGAAAAGPNSG